MFGLFEFWVVENGGVVWYEGEGVWFWVDEEKWVDVFERVDVVVWGGGEIGGWWLIGKENGGGMVGECVGGGRV